ncbi:MULTISPECIES: L-threonylcarbamoyladenylate synthase [unclassified Leptolyngbya]|uniref:L-threonylcarbamoyladenylate synthase n=1 Tax=unclassified Leptolyngbya TaxID=2650499 RepID=UPI001681EC88|nr:MULTISPECIES: L-threonylcarbamoyladenylate synthase [unclassified Leptolyngbya]MBD1911991.1 L-threonylcarbamoyladenylate synthase [Leptolyngbya sp. FACHB-8]MBD2155361.1 L-threonylcarbamoyladenylate synthase [Leptolyngbya sp. FACHB-16]
MAQVSFKTLVEAAEKGDRLISFPTDTVPALASRPDAAALIYAAKQRSETKPLILMGGDPADLWPYVTGTDTERAIWQRVVDTYWPGALTLVLPASDRLPSAMNPSDPTTIGIRVPNRAIARHLLRHTGPLATTSINRSGKPPLQTIAEINEQFPEVLTFAPAELEALEGSLADNLGNKAANSGQPSTVAKWTEDGWQVLRAGSIALSADAGR